MNEEITRANSPADRLRLVYKRGTERRQIKVDRRASTDDFKTDKLQYMEVRVDSDRNADNRKNTVQRRGSERRQDMPLDEHRGDGWRPVSAQSAQPQIIIKTALAEITFSGCDLTVIYNDSVLTLAFSPPANILKQ